MPIQRQDLASKTGLYQLPNIDGLWKVHGHNDMPTIEMHNIETGETKLIQMSGMENVRSVLVRQLEPGEEIKEPTGASGPDESAQAELAELGLKVNALSADNAMLGSMLRDALELTSQVLEKDRPGKELKTMLESWHEQVAEILSAEEVKDDSNQDDG